MPLLPLAARPAVRCLVAGAAILPATLADAQTFDVKGLDMTPGALELGLDNTAHAGLPNRAGINRSAHDQSLDYSVTDWWRLSGVIKLEDASDDDFRIAGTAIESIFALRPVPERGGIGMGWFASLELSTHEATTNSGLFGPIVTLQADKLSFTANPFLEKTFGRNSVEGIALNYGWNLKYQLNDVFAFGVEGFGLIENLGDPPPFDEQEHRAGPAVFTAIRLADNLTVTPDVSILFGLTRATPDVTFKLNVGIPLLQPAQTKR